MFKTLTLPKGLGEKTSVPLMHSELITFYSKMVVNVVRSPRSPIWANRLPRGLFAPDSFLGYSKLGRDLLLNNGQHMHGILLIPKKSQLKVPLDVLVKGNMTYYSGDKILDIDIQLVEGHDVIKVIQYSGKAVKKHQFSMDDILILPRTIGEVLSWKRKGR
jgi:hypothetical protein